MVRELLLYLIPYIFRFDTMVLGMLGGYLTATNIIILVVTWLAYRGYRSVQRPPEFPPGPSPVPFLGNMLSKLNVYIGVCSYLLPHPQLFFK